MSEHEDRQAQRGEGRRARARARRHAGALGAPRRRHRGRGRRLGAAEERDERVPGATETSTRTTRPLRTPARPTRSTLLRERHRRDGRGRRGRPAVRRGRRRGVGRRRRRAAPGSSPERARCRTGAPRVATVERIVVGRRGRSPSARRRGRRRTRRSDCASRGPAPPGSSAPGARGTPCARRAPASARVVQEEEFVRDTRRPGLSASWPPEAASSTRPAARALQALICAKWPGRAPNSKWRRCSRTSSPGAKAESSVGWNTSTVWSTALKPSSPTWCSASRSVAPSQGASRISSASWWMTQSVSRSRPAPRCGAAAPPILAAALAAGRERSTVWRSPRPSASARATGRLGPVLDSRNLHALLVEREQRRGDHVGLVGRGRSPSP